MFQEAQPVPSTELSGSAVLKPSVTAVDVKPSSSGARQDDVMVPQVVSASSPAELPTAGLASTDDVSPAESPPSISEDVTGYRIVFCTCCRHVLIASNHSVCVI